MTATLPTASYPLPVRIALANARALGRNRVVVIESIQTGAVHTVSLRPQDDMDAQLTRIASVCDRHGNLVQRIAYILTV